MSEQLELFPNDFPITKELEQLPKNYIKQAEWCFQFFDNEPVPFAFSKTADSKKPLVLEIHPIEGEGMEFSYKGMTFKIFGREMDDKTKQKVADASQN